MIKVKRAIMYGARDLRIEEQSYDMTLKPTQLFVRTEITGFSTGTDLANYEGRSLEVPDAPDYPRSVGYSNIGIVESVGEAVKLFRPGERIFSMMHHCSAYVADEGEILVHVPESVDVDQAALTYLAHLGVAALRQVGYEPGEDVVVVGLGVIGLCTVAAARAMGARVISVSNDTGRARIAHTLGSIETLMSGSFVPSTVFAGQGADIVVLTANTWSAYRISMEMARRGGRISVLGFPGRAQPAPDFNPVDMRWLYGKQLTIKGVGHIARVDCEASEIRFNLRRDIKYVIDMMASGTLDLSPIVSHRFHWSNLKEAYELALQHSKELSAAVFHWS